MFKVCLFSVVRVHCFLASAVDVQWILLEQKLAMSFASRPIGNLGVPLRAVLPAQGVCRC